MSIFDKELSADLLIYPEILQTQAHTVTRPLLYFNFDCNVLNGKKYFHTSTAF
jgi:hypothetical protein